MLNKAFLIGNCGKDPEARATAGGGKIVKFSLATSHKYKNKDGERVVDTTWHNCVAFGKVAELIEEYVVKGSKLYIDGRIENRKVESDDGPAKFFSSIIVEQVRFLDGKKDGEDRPKSSKDKKRNADEMMGDDEIPY